jgi:hypothetical protein
MWIWYLNPGKNCVMKLDWLMKQIKRHAGLVHDWIYRLRGLFGKLPGEVSPGGFTHR